ncbi:SLATT domain-containing protein [Saccharopolyspora shandongensis]|uniref:SLATT domain-containing protein n=1 Tax=Saccharopolyspora shandongensis TaxID=418495 RepID=UPI001FEBE4D2|nr:DUF4231 domain-containing protein [Saccharopolyspora shandongensis]
MTSPKEEPTRPKEEALLKLDQKITVASDLLRRAKRRARIGVLALIIAPVPLGAAAVAWYVLPPGDRLSLSFLLIIVGATLGGYGVWTRYKPGVLITPNESGFCKWKNNERVPPASLELECALLRQERFSHPDVKKVDHAERRAAHKEEVMFYVDELRQQATQNRRLNHIMQVTTIVGSLGATGLTSLSFALEAFRTVALVINFIVGAASGVAAYFKYKDRSFYAQQTANAIEQEWHAYSLGIGKYAKEKEDGRALVLFSEEVHRLRVEQKNREQNLDQPSKRHSEGE